MTKVGELIEAARSSAGRVATPDSEEVSSLTGEIWTALEASIEQSFQSVLKDLENLEQRSKLAKVRENSQGAPVEPGPDAQPRGCDIGIEPPGLTRGYEVPFFSILLGVCVAEPRTP